MAKESFALVLKEEESYALCFLAYMYVFATSLLWLLSLFKIFVDMLSAFFFLVVLV